MDNTRGRPKSLAVKFLPQGRGISGNNHLVPEFLYSNLYSFSRYSLTRLCTSTLIKKYPLGWTGTVLRKKPQGTTIFIEMDGMSELCVEFRALAFLPRSFRNQISPTHLFLSQNLSLQVKRRECSNFTDTRRGTSEWKRDAVNSSLVFKCITKWNSILIGREPGSKDEEEP